jgi:hypothetical protein
MIKKSQQHLEKANEHYFEHMTVALRISFQLLIGAVMAFMHGLIPSLFTTNSSNIIKKLYSFIDSRNKN